MQGLGSSATRIDARAFRWHISRQSKRSGFDLNYHLVEQCADRSIASSQSVTLCHVAADLPVGSPSHLYWRSELRLSSRGLLLCALGQRTSREALPVAITIRCTAAHTFEAISCNVIARIVMSKHRSPSTSLEAEMPASQ